MKVAIADLDPRQVPNYTIAEAAHYLRIPASTLRSWVCGRYYPTQKGKRLFGPIITFGGSSKEPRLMSFINLVEAHVLDAIRRTHQISLPKVRTALKYLEKHFPSQHPLADQAMETDGKDLFVEKFGQLINLSSEGQLAMKELMQAHLRRIQRDEHGVPTLLFLFTRKQQLDEPRLIVVNPFVSFGKPVIAGTGIPTVVIADRWKAGESFEELMEDYGLTKEQIEEAIRCEFEIKAA